MCFSSLLQIAKPANCKDKEVYQLEAGKLIAILICGTLRGGRC